MHWCVQSVNSEQLNVYSLVCIDNNVGSIVCLFYFSHRIMYLDIYTSTFLFDTGTYITWIRATAGSWHAIRLYQLNYVVHVVYGYKILRETPSLFVF